MYFIDYIKTRVPERSAAASGLHVVFMPERTTDSGGNKSKQFLQGCKVEELPLNTVEKEEP